MQGRTDELQMAMTRTGTEQFGLWPNTSAFKQAFAYGCVRMRMGPFERLDKKVLIIN